MARPQKFRHSREALTDPQIAAKLGALVLDIEGLRQKRKQIDDQIAAGYDAVDDAGFEKKFVRKVIALRAKEEGARHDEEEGLETYEFAIEQGVSLACARRKGSLPAHDPLTGELHDTQEQPETAIEMDRAEVSGNSGQLVAAEKGREAIPAGPEGADLSHAGADESSAADGQDVEATVEQRPSATNHQSTGVLPAGGSSPSASEIDEIAEPAQPSPPKQAEPIKAGEGVPPLSPAILSDEEVVPAFMKGKPGCLKLRDGHCKIGFATEALCAECADKRARAMA